MARKKAELNPDGTRKWPTYPELANENALLKIALQKAGTKVLPFSLDRVPTGWLKRYLSHCSDREQGLLLLDLVWLVVCTNPKCRNATMTSPNDPTHLCPTCKLPLRDGRHVVLNPNWTEVERGKLWIVTQTKAAAATDDVLIDEVLSKQPMPVVRMKDLVGQ